MWENMPRLHANKIILYNQTELLWIWYLGVMEVISVDAKGQLYVFLIGG